MNSKQSQRCHTALPFQHQLPLPAGINKRARREAAFLNPPLSPPKLALLALIMSSSLSGAGQHSSLRHFVVSLSFFCPLFCSCSSRVVSVTSIHDDLSLENLDPRELSLQLAISIARQPTRASIASWSLFEAASKTMRNAGSHAESKKGVLETIVLRYCMIMSRKTGALRLRVVARWCNVSAAAEAAATARMTMSAEDERQRLRVREEASEVGIRVIVAHVISHLRVRCVGAARAAGVNPGINFVRMCSSAARCTGLERT